MSTYQGRRKVVRGEMEITFEWAEELEKFLSQGIKERNGVGPSEDSSVEVDPGRTSYTSSYKSTREVHTLYIIFNLLHL